MEGNRDSDFEGLIKIHCANCGVENVTGGVIDVFRAVGGQNSDLSATKVAGTSAAKAGKQIYVPNKKEKPNLNRDVFIDTLHERTIQLNLLSLAREEVGTKRAPVLVKLKVIRSVSLLIGVISRILVEALISKRVIVENITEIRLDIYLLRGTSSLKGEKVKILGMKVIRTFVLVRETLGTTLLTVSLIFRL